MRPLDVNIIGCVPVMYLLILTVLLVVYGE